MTDAALLAVAADGAILVVKHGKTWRRTGCVGVPQTEQVRRVPARGGAEPRAFPELGDASYGYGYGTYASSYYHRAAEQTTERKLREHRPRRGIHQPDAEVEVPEQIAAGEPTRAL